MFAKIISIVSVLVVFSFIALAEADIDQWQDVDKTYIDLVEEGFEVKAYDMNTIKTESGFLLMFFVTVLQKDKEVYECQEYQTLDETMQTIDLNFANLMKLPTFKVEGKVFIKWVTLIIENSIIKKVFYPIFPPDLHIKDVINWLKNN